MTMPTEKPLGLASRTNENRRASKPLMEKRRRARINQSLLELKSLILDAVKKDAQNTRHSKLEKADILEMTVKHLQTLHSQQLTASSSQTEVVSEGKYRAGYAECAKEVSRFILKAEDMDPRLRCRLMNHLATNLASLNSDQGAIAVSSSLGEDRTNGFVYSSNQQCSSLDNTNGASMSPDPSVNYTTPTSSQEATCVSSPSSSTSSSHHVHSPGPSESIGGVPLIASRLPNGQIAFIVPGSYVESTAHCYSSVPLDLATSVRHEPERPSSTASPLSGCSTPSSDQGIYHSDSDMGSDRHQDSEVESLYLGQHDLNQRAQRLPLPLEPMWRPW